MNTPSHRQDLELGWLRLQRMLEGIEGMALNGRRHADSVRQLCEVPVRH